jgi:glycine oxidase
VQPGAAPGVRGGSPAADVLIVGGGVMGCAVALALATRGVKTTVLERSVPGAEASIAAAGILGAQAEAHADGPMARLCLASRERFAALAAELFERTSIDVGYRRSGVVQVAFDAEQLDAAWRAVAWQRDAGLAVERLDAVAARTLEPALSDATIGALHFVDDARVDPPTYLRALRIAAERAGARFQSGSFVRRIVVAGRFARGVVMEDGSEITADWVVLAAGSWSTLVEGTPLPPGSVRPARGQIVELLLPAPLVERVVYGPRAYLSPRDDGRVLVGSTLEFVGFRPGVTAAAVRDLLAGAIELAPALGGADLGRCWSGLRPHTPDELPVIGSTSVARLLLATGHFRNGILLSPITAEVIAALVVGAPLPADMAPFAESRHG